MYIQITLVCNYKGANYLLELQKRSKLQYKSVLQYLRVMDVPGALNLLKLQ